MKPRTIVPASLLTALLVLVGGAPLTAQVSPADAEAFLGDWVATLQGPQGSIDLDIQIADEGGQLTGQVGGPQGAMNEVETFSLSNGSLVLGYTVDFGGQSAPIEMTLTPEGEELSFTMSFGGQQGPTGTATRQ